MCVVGLFPLSGFVSVFFREASPATVNFMKTLVEGPWLCYVFFEAMPAGGRVAVIPFMVGYFAWEGFIAYLGFSNDKRFDAVDGIGAMLAIILTVVAYLYFKKASEVKISTPNLQEQDSKEK